MFAQPLAPGGAGLLQRRAGAGSSAGQRVSAGRGCCLALPPVPAEGLFETPSSHEGRVTRGSSSSWRWVFHREHSEPQKQFTAAPLCCSGGVCVRAPGSPHPLPQEHPPVPARGGNTGLWNRCSDDTLKSIFTESGGSPAPALCERSCSWLVGLQLHIL